MSGSAITKEAVAQLQKDPDVDPDLAYTRYRLGMIYSRTRKYEEAVGQYRQAIEREPDNALFHYALGGCVCPDRKGRRGDRRV